MLIENNGYYLSERQFCMLLIEVSLPFKIAMLPSLISLSAGRDGVIVILAVLILEIIAATAVFSISKQGGLVNLFRAHNPAQKVFVAVIAVSVAVFGAAKLTLNMTEFLNYVSLTLFDDIGWTFIIVTLLPVLYALTRSKANVGGRCAQICFRIFTIVIFVCALFCTYKFDQPLKPLLENGASPVLDSVRKYAFRGFDFLPLAFLPIKHSPNETHRGGFKLTLLFYAVLLTGFYYLAYSMYGNALAQADNLFARIAVYHSVSDEIKVLDFPIIISWLISAILNMSVLLFGVKSMSLTFFKKDRLSAATLMIIGVTLLFFVGGNHEISEFFTHPAYSVWTIFTALSLLILTVFCYNGKETDHAA